jgi:hypothetical protein
MSKKTIAPMPAANYAKQEREWRAQDDLRILRQAEEIRMDKSRLTHASKMAEREMKALQKVAGKPKPATRGGR